MLVLLALMASSSFSQGAKKGIPPPAPTPPTPSAAPSSASGQSSAPTHNGSSLLSGILERDGQVIATVTQHTTGSDTISDTKAGELEWTVSARG